ncbi:GDP-mannose-dependent alpha-(1-6)-phosphatidylinositol monomannoside mannosyltransferase [Thalassoglobus polymorphus]|uniref:GDP-mannose-dependent alpha-(1-6)-phosphatidylinositol monomannoside mannosyltransferase n=2 Tax=Thalassoglobus polymorphus TaxID=2527994 RepID=A0A517QSN9_9PLAN|nr:GDP-mannose-dependent alpha-(1-6)-phosphatidylinositol monomannoside mannosyltransferase [Thalassoglobus polymorphus]
MLVLTGNFPTVSQTFVLREIQAAKELGWSVHVIASGVGNETDLKQASEYGISQKEYSILNWRYCIPTFNCKNKKIIEAAERDKYGWYLSLKRKTYFKKLLKHAFVQQADLIHAHFVQWASEVGVGLSRILGIPLTIEAHDGHLPLYPKETLTKVQNTASAIGCVSNEWVDVWANKTGSREKLHWLPNGVDLGEFKIAPQKTSKTPVIISVSNCVEHKRPQDLLQAAAILKKKELDFKMVIVGGGPFLTRLRKLSSDLALNDTCRLIGAQPHSRVREEFLAADIFALCSERESFGIVTVEAMSSGLPTITSRTAGAKDIVLEGETGYTFNAGDVASLTQHLERLIKDHRLRRSMGLKGRDRASSKFSWQNHMNIVSGMWHMPETQKRTVPQSHEDPHE